MPCSWKNLKTGAHLDSAIIETSMFISLTRDPIGLKAGEVCQVSLTFATPSPPLSKEFLN